VVSVPNGFNLKGELNLDYIDIITITLKVKKQCRMITGQKDKRIN
jgi:hypothetical protein